MTPEEERHVARLLGVATRRPKTASAAWLYVRLVLGVLVVLLLAHLAARGAG
jgi:hypothetical protein